MIQSYEGHCGYTWTWNTLSLFPYTVGSDYHDFHHAMNVGNYGSIFVFWDALFKT
jgi:sterol desaturase/sphingolipid hydroxylase (fatty acid hydroxylase superfamily)